MVTVGIIGATGYAGVELLRILLRHPHVKYIYCSSVSFEGQNIDDVYPNLKGMLGDKCGRVPLSADEIKEKADILFTALPHGIAEQYADYCVKNGKKLIDLSADFRYGTDEATFTKWYKKTWDFPEVHQECVYGSPEMNRESIRSARIIGNPGCYVTSVTLGLLPALKNSLVDVNTIIADSKSGVTGAGRNPSMTNQFCECGESFSAYKVGNHRHQSEIERNLSILAGTKANVIFTPHLIPQNRGILSTIYAPLTQSAVGTIAVEAEKRGCTPDEVVRDIYRKTYENEPFVRVLDAGVTYRFMLLTVEKCLKS